MANPQDFYALQTAATTTATGNSFSPPVKGLRCFQATLTCSSGNCTGTVVYEVSIDSANWITMATTTFTSAASPQSDGFTSDASWPYVRSRISAITGTNAAISTYMVVTF